MKFEQPKLPKKKEPEFKEGEILPGGYYQPKGLEIKIGKNVEKLLEQNLDPEMLPYAKSLLKDMAEDYKLLGRQISETIDSVVAKINGYIERIDQKEEE